MSVRSSMLETNQFVQLVLFRIRYTLREPQFLFWMFGFPLLTTLALGLAFSRDGDPRFQVALVGEPVAGMERLLESRDFQIKRLSQVDAEWELREQKLALAILAGAPPTLLHDPTRQDARAALALAQEALEGPTAGPRPARVSAIQSKRHRYIDFLVPGIIGWNILGLSFSIIATVTANQRGSKLMKRLAATPMRRSDFLISLVVARCLIALLEVAATLLLGRLVFDVGEGTNYLEFISFAMIGTLSTSGLALLIGSRAPNDQSVNGLIGLVNLGMVFFSGVFFPADQFPDVLQPAIRLLPLTVLNDGLRAILNDETSMTALGYEMAVLMGWGLVSYAVALKIFRWR